MQDRAALFAGCVFGDPAAVQVEGGGGVVSAVFAKVDSAAVHLGCVVIDITVIAVDVDCAAVG